MANYFQFRNYPYCFNVAKYDEDGFAFPIFILKFAQDNYSMKIVLYCNNSKIKNI